MSFWWLKNIQFFVNQFSKSKFSKNRGFCLDFSFFCPSFRISCTTFKSFSFSFFSIFDFANSKLNSIFEIFFCFFFSRWSSWAMARWSTVLSGVFLALSMVLSLGKLLMLAATNGNNGELSEADEWLAEIGLKQYRPIFRKKGEHFQTKFPEIFSERR